MKMLDTKADSSMAGDNQGYNPQGSYNQPASQYDAPSSNYGGNQPKQSFEQRIPEIDIEEDEIPF